jgi:hypothetical protein
MDEPRTCDRFVCTACGVDVISLPPRDPPPTKCGTCQLLDTLDLEPAEREELRARMMRRADD